MLQRRLQILIDEERYGRVLARARACNLSVGAVIREAVDSAFPAISPGRSDAAGRILSAARMSVGDPGELRAELEEIRGRRA